MALSSSSLSPDLTAFLTWVPHLSLRHGYHLAGLTHCSTENAFLPSGKALTRNIHKEPEELHRENIWETQSITENLTGFST